jgi:hypothetical protein
MSNKRSAKSPAMQLERAQYEVEQAKKRLSTTMGALQYRLKPGNLVSNAWDGVREKGSEAADGALVAVSDIADGAVEAVKARPVAASGALAAALLFLARGPIKRGAFRLFSRNRDEGIVKTDLSDTDENYDLTAPSVKRSSIQGVSA